MRDLIVRTLVSSVASIAILAAVAVLLRTWIREWIARATEHVYARRLETLKADLGARNAKGLETLRDQFQREQAIVVAATSSFLAARGAAHDRTLEGVRDLWCAVLGLRATGSRILGVTSFLTADEIRAIPGTPKFKDVLASFQDVFKNEALSSDSIEHVRPFVGELLWALYFSQRSFIGRMCVLFASDGPGINKGHLVYYMEDPGILQILGAVLTSEELALVKGRVVGAYDWARSMIEEKIIVQARKVIEGETAAEAALDQARRIIRASADVPRGVRDE